MGRFGHRLVAITAAAAIGLLTLGAAGAQAQGAGDGRRVLVFSKTAAFRHSSIPAGVQAIRELGTENGFAVDATEDGAAFTAENLARYDAVIWLSTTGDVLDAPQQKAFEDYIESGGGYAGVHAASDTEYTWGWYGGLVGSYFNGHPAIQGATVDVADRAHPSTKDLPARWERTDEWYNFQSNPRGRVHVLATLDERTYAPGGGAIGNDHPIAWCHYYRGGRSWYTGMGHADESFRDPAFRKHLLGGILWAAGAVTNDCGGTVNNNFQKVVLDDNVASPMGLEVAPDGRVIYIERAGQVRVIDPVTSTTKTALSIPVHDAQENGLLGIALDPRFATNGWVYLYYSPPSSTIPSPRQHLSRFTMTGDVIDAASEKVILQVPHQRDQCCHSGGYMQFDAAGNLFLSIGDDTSPGASDGFTPIDERPGREAFDAQRSSANTNDLRGKLLRITPTDAGGYTIPAGNLFAPGQMGTRPEIYAMGFRNPFRFSVDQRTGWVYLADYGPDASAGDQKRGTDGRVEWNLIKRPGNYGWPYCHGGAPFIDYDFATGQSAAAFDCAQPVNDSPNNTGLRNLPPAVEPTLWYGRGTAHAELGRGGAPMGGPRYVFDPTVPAERRWPQYFEGSALFYEWGQNKLYEFHLGDDGTLHDTTPLLTSMTFSRPHEVKFGRHDGALYMIEWGSGFNGDNPDAQVVRVDYAGGQVNPVAKASAAPLSGARPLTVNFSSAGTSHPQGSPLTHRWTFGDGASSDAPNPTHTYTEEGNYTAILTVTDAQGRTGTANVVVSVGNTQPQVKIEWPVQGGVFAYGDEVAYKVRVDDVEDGSTETGAIDCSRVVVELILGHDDHGHPMQQKTGCQGSFVLEADGGHTDTDRITYALEARYTDRGSPNGQVAPMRGSALSVLQSKRKQAEHHDADGNIRKETTADPLGGNQNVGFLQDNMSLTFSDVNLVNVDTIRFRIAAPNATSRIEVRKDGKTGQLLGSANVPNTGGFQNWNWVDVPVVDPGETFDMYLVFRGASGYLYNLNWLDFVGPGLAGGPPTVGPPSATTAPTAPDGTAGWFKSPVELTLASDAAREYRVGTGAWTSYRAPVRFDADGVYRVDYRARADGRPSSGRTLEFKLDQAAPTTTASLEGVTEGQTFTGAVRITLAAADATSGVARTEYRLAGETATYSGPFTLPPAEGERTLEYRAVDAAGNAEPWRSASFRSPSGIKPSVQLEWPRAGAVVPASGRIPFRVSVSGRAGIDCADVTVRVLFDHAGHTHTGGSATGCTGTVAATPPAGHPVTDFRGYVLEATYTADAGAAGHVPLIRGQATLGLQPPRKQAEHYDTDASIRTEATGDTLGGGLNVGFIRNGLTLGYSGVNLAGVSAIRLRLATNTIGGTVEIRKNTATGPLLGSTTVTSTGGFQSYRYFDAQLTGVTDETIKLMLVFKATGTHYIANINFFEFVGEAIQPQRLPELSLPTDQAARSSTATGASVTFAPTATDPYDGDVAVTCDPASGSTFPVGTTTVTCTATNAGGHTATGMFRVTVTQVVGVDGSVGGTVPPTLALTLGATPSFGSFQPGVARTYDAQTAATVISSAGDAALSVSDPSAGAPGRLVNGAHSLASPLQIRAGDGAFATVGASPVPLLGYGAPVSNEQVTLGLRQQIAATEPLRTGQYSKTLTFTLSTTSP